MMQNDFMNLLVAQLQHQDPLSPMDAMEFTSQLTQFAELEQLFYVNDNLKYLQIAQTSINNMQAAAFIGKEVKARGDVLHLKDGQIVPLSYRLENQAASVNVRIMDENGRMVRSYELGRHDEGNHTIQWDGRDGLGNKVPEGDYQFVIDASGTNEEKIEVSTFIQGRITGLSFEGSIPLLHIGPNKVPIGDVYEIFEGGKEETPETPPESAPSS